MLLSPDVSGSFEHLSGCVSLEAANAAIQTRHSCAEQIEELCNSLLLNSSLQWDSRIFEHYHIYQSSGFEPACECLDDTYLGDHIHGSSISQRSPTIRPLRIRIGALYRQFLRVTIRPLRILTYTFFPGVFFVDVVLVVVVLVLVVLVVVVLVVVRAR